MDNIAIYYDLQELHQHQVSAKMCIHEKGRQEHKVKRETREIIEGDTISMFLFLFFFFFFVVFVGKIKYQRNEEFLQTFFEYRITSIRSHIV